MAPSPTYNTPHDEAQRLLYECQQAVGCIGCYLFDTDNKTMTDWCREVIDRLRRVSAIVDDLPPRVPGTPEYY
jgi:hypothetical protein